LVHPLHHSPSYPIPLLNIEPVEIEEGEEGRERRKMEGVN
jgi:hypothetical protein